MGHVDGCLLPIDRETIKSLPPIASVRHPNFSRFSRGQKSLDSPDTVPSEAKMMQNVSDAHHRRRMNEYSAFVYSH